jgi:hypothetical protein
MEFCARSLFRRRKATIFLWLAIDVAAVALVVIQIMPTRQQGHATGTAAGSFPSLGPVAMQPLPLNQTATDFALPRVVDSAPVKLSDLYSKKPVVLILSSFT